MITIVAFIVILGLIIFVHELGHFVAAKSLGVGVKTFAFGFPPKIFSRKYKGTEYALNLIPFGGYVRLLGENEDAEELELANWEKETGKKAPKRLFDIGNLELLLIFSAGVIMNILLAVFFLWLLYVAGFKPIELGPLSEKVFPGIDGGNGVASTLQVKIDGVEKNTPAEEQDLKSGDVIVAVNGEKVYFSGEVISKIQSEVTGDGAKVNLTVKRDNLTLEKTLKTYKAKVTNTRGKEQEVNRIGIVLETKGEIKTGPLNAVKTALVSTSNIIKFTFISIGDLFYKIFTRFQLSENIAGPIGVVAGTSYYAHLGLVPSIQFAIVLSIGVALFNILPIPALDGGYVAFTIIESIIRKKISLKVKNALTMLGFIVLILFIIVVSYRDFISFGVSHYLLKIIGK